MFVTAAVVSMTVLAALPVPEAPNAMPAHAQGRMYPIRRTGNYPFTRNGREWVGRSMIGPEPTHHRTSCEVPPMAR